MKLRHLALAVPLAAGLALAACSSDDSAAPSTAPSSTPSTTTSVTPTSTTPPTIEDTPAPAAEEPAVEEPTAPVPGVDCPRSVLGDTNRCADPTEAQAEGDATEQYWRDHPDQLPQTGNESGVDWQDKNTNSDWSDDEVDAYLACFEQYDYSEYAAEIC